MAFASETGGSDGPVGVAEVGGDVSAIPRTVPAAPPRDRILGTDRTSSSSGRRQGRQRCPGEEAVRGKTAQIGLSSLWIGTVGIGDVVLQKGRSPLSIVVGLAVCGVLLIGCANRPTAQQLQESILIAAENDPTVSLSPEQARCIADRLLDTDLSDTTLDGLAANFDEPQVLSAEVNRVEPAVADAAATCVDPNQ